MPIQLFKVTKRGADKLLHELGGMNTSRSTTHNNDMATTISMSFGYIPVQGSSNKYVVRGTADEFALLIPPLARAATSYEECEKGGAYRFAPAAARAAYAIAWLRAIADKMESDAARRALLSDPPRGMANAKSTLRLLNLYLSTGTLPNGLMPVTLREEATEFTGVKYDARQPGTEAARDGLKAWIAEREGGPT